MGLRVILFIVLLISVTACYSDMTIKESYSEKISKVKMKDGSEIQFRESRNIIQSQNLEFIIYTNEEGDIKKIYFDDIAELYVHKFDFGKTFFSVFWILAGLLTILIISGFRYSVGG